jgi:hypothetical protein
MPKVDLAEAHVEGHHLAGLAGDQGQGVGVVGLGRAGGLAGHDVQTHVAHAVEEQARKVGDGFGLVRMWALKTAWGISST